MKNKRTGDAGSQTDVPRIYEETPDDRSTLAVDRANPLAKLSNAKSLPRIIRKPRPTEPLDPRVARLLGFVDGRTPLGIIFQSAGMDEGDAVAVLAQLLDLGIIDVR